MELNIICETWFVRELLSEKVPIEQASGLFFKSFSVLTMLKIGIGL